MFRAWNICQSCVAKLNKVKEKRRNYEEPSWHTRLTSATKERLATWSLPDTGGNYNRRAPSGSSSPDGKYLSLNR